MASRPFNPLLVAWRQQALFPVKYAPYNSFHGPWQDVGKLLLQAMEVVAAQRQADTVSSASTENSRGAEPSSAIPAEEVAGGQFPGHDLALVPSMNHHGRSAEQVEGPGPSSSPCWKRRSPGS
jgi:hypothetical protein